MSEYKVGISSFTYNFACGTIPIQRPEKPWTPFDLIKKAEELGAEVLQFGNNMPLENCSDEDLDRIREEAKRAGLILEVGMREGTLERLENYIRITERLQSKLLRVILEGDDAEGSYNPSMEEICDNIRKILPTLESKGIILGIENYDRKHTEFYAEICRRIDSKWVGLTVDTTNSLSLEEPLDQVLREMAPYCVCLHIKDYDIVRNHGGIGLKIIGACFGSGRMEAEKSFRYCKEKSGNAFNLILESWMEPANSLEESLKQEEIWAKEGLQQLKNLVKE